MAAYTTIDKPTDFFNTKLFVGNSSTNAITGVGHQPDWTWIKRRDGGNGYSNFLFDAVRGVNKGISSNQTAAEQTFTNGFNSFDSDGFTLGANTSGSTATEINYSGGNYVSWNWKAGTSFSNSSGSNGANLDSTGSVSTTAGFSIVSFTGNRSTTRNIYHGLGAVPKMIIFKNRSTTNGWTVYNEAIGNANKLTLNATNASGGCSACFGSTTPTSTLFTVGDDSDTNGTSNNMIAYCFAEKQGYSKFGSYTGNGNDDAPFVYLGFKPAWTMIKRTNSADNWVIDDATRSPFNLMENTIYANLANEEYTSNLYGIDFTAQGFKIRDNDGNYNGSGSTYIYMAFAENPFTTSTGIPATAR